MFRLTREVRFAVSPTRKAEPAGPATNGYAGVPALDGLGYFYTLQVTLAGDLDPNSQYVRNIKDIDDAVRKFAVPVVAIAAQEKTFGGGGKVIGAALRAVETALPDAKVEAVRLSLSPFLSLSAFASESPMVRLSQTFEFSAAHRLHNPALDDAANRATFGKCNNPLGHGHNYQVQVTLAGEPDANGVLIAVPAFERTVAETVIDRFDHKHLNLEVPEFSQVIPSVENIARVIYRLLKPRFADQRAQLASVTVWETPKTWCEYAE